MAVNITDEWTSDGEKFREELEKLCSKAVFVGFQMGENFEDDGTDIAEIAAWNEYGTATIPARPFIAQTFDKNDGKVQDLAVKLVQQSLNADDTLKKIGVYCKGLMQEEIVSGGFAPNAPSTIRKKGSATPLIDTGHMRQSVNYVILDKSEVD